MNLDREETISILKRYFEAREDVVMAFVFGSLARGTIGVESDIDIAVFFRASCGHTEWEGPESRFPEEDEIWSDLERMLGRNVDLLVLNRAPATVAESALRGIPLVIKDRSSYLSFLLRITSEATDFRQWVEDFRNLREMRRHGAPA